MSLTGYGRAEIGSFHQPRYEGHHAKGRCGHHDERADDENDGRRIVRNLIATAAAYAAPMFLCHQTHRYTALQLVYIVM